MTEDTGAGEAMEREIVALRGQIDELANRLAVATTARDAANDRLTTERAEMERKRNDAVADAQAAKLDIQRLADEKAALERKVAEAAAKAQAAQNEAAAKVDMAREETARLRTIMDSTPEPQLLDVAQRDLTRGVKFALAFTRDKIPADGPWRGRFDEAVDIITRAGCIAVQLTSEFLRWATPRVIELTKRGVKEVEARLAKK